MDIDIAQDVKKYVVRFFAVLGLLVVCSAYFMIQMNQNNRTAFVIEGHLVYRIENIFSASSGTVEDIMVEEGSSADEGAVLVTIHNALSKEELLHLQQKIDLSKRNLAQLQNGVIGNTTISIRSNETNHELLEAQTRMERMKSLYEMGAISAAKRDEAIASYELIKSTSSYSSTASPKIVADANTIDAAKRQVKTAEEALKKAKEGGEMVDVVSLKAGTVTNLSIVPGAHVEAGDVLLQMRLAENPWIETEVTGEEIDKVYLGQLVEYQLGQIKASGTVQEISDIEGKEAGKHVVVSVSADMGQFHGDTEHIKLHFIP